MRHFSLGLVCLMLLLLSMGTHAKILFEGLNSGDENAIFVMDDDGSNVIQLTPQMKYPSFPRWSPDGEQIVFQMLSRKVVWQSI